ncbi:hypothetical protein BFW87_17530 [Pseudomonas fluorescens]|uniref:Uncharacterized protein n=1 Tax=Pseudomonas fluorescens TaxID=294 RepID=A0A1T2YL75_PSEFL|nr:hypothetical protein [Pseudomonas fluorescens]OPA92413.1 hypothetical protein BFW87_17530 [Pseudomonas fluorescens]
MSFGLSAVNGGGAVVIGSDSKVLVFSERGEFRIQSRYTDAPGYGVFYFAKPILTQEPPQVFLRIVTPSHISLSLYTTLLGAPGSWTGFKVTSGAMGGKSLQNHLMEFVSCKYSDHKSTSAYGMEIYEGDGNVSFSSSDRVVKYGRFTKSWTYSQPSTFFNNWDSGIVMTPDEFVSVSSMDRGVSWFVNHAQYASLHIMTGNVRKVEISVQRSTLGDSINVDNLGVTYFSIPICKFPIERYYN